MGFSNSLSLSLSFCVCVNGKLTRVCSGEGWLGGMVWLRAEYLSSAMCVYGICVQVYRNVDIFVYTVPRARSLRAHARGFCVCVKSRSPSCAPF